MQLKLRRSQRTGGLLGDTAIFCLDARAELSQAEQADVKRYKLGRLIIYSSSDAEKYRKKFEAADDGSALGTLKMAGFAVLTALKLNISIDSLQKGHHIECKSMDELLGAEGALREACDNMKRYLDAAATFDGREVVIDYSSHGEVVVADAVPRPALALTGSPLIGPPALSIGGPQLLSGVAEAAIAEPLSAPIPTASSVQADAGLGARLADFRRLLGAGTLARVGATEQIKNLIAAGAGVGLLIILLVLQLPFIWALLLGIVAALLARNLLTRP